MNFNPKPLYLGRAWGIPILAHYSWLPVFPIYTWVISQVLLPRNVPGMPAWEYWVLGILTSVLLFASVLIHELAHSIMAKVEGVGTGGITLYLFGGLSSLGGQPARPSSEFKIAVVGPAASFLLGALFFGLHWAFLNHSHYLAVSQVVRHLGIVNWVLAGFNTLPGMPLDGGRVLRAIVWQVNKNYREATRIAVRSGFTISLALLVYGVVALKSDIVFALWSLIIGVLLATMLVSQTRGGQGARKPAPGTVEALMSRDVVMVSPEVKVQDFIDKILRNNRFTSFPVAVERKLHGLIVLETLKSVSQDQWPVLTAGEVMKPVDESMFINSRATVAEARSLLSRNGIGRAAVIDGHGLVVGYISKSDVEKE